MSDLEKGLERRMKVGRGLARFSDGAALGPRQGTSSDETFVDSVCIPHMIGPALVRVVSTMAIEDVERWTYQADLLRTQCEDVHNAVDDDLPDTLFIY